ncbi:lantibiotic dehydratase [Streptococcus suis]|nr:lantibiotic dehydratase [Streptococcus suis]
MNIEIFDFFLERHPLYSFEKLVDLPIGKKELSDDELINFFYNDKIFLEAILIARPKLYSLVQEYFEGKLKLKKVRRLSQTLYKYYLRICSRTTPYGLFSTVNFSDEFDYNQISPTVSVVRKHVSVSFGWMSKIIKKIELDSYCNVLLHFSLNRSLIYKKEFIDNPFISIQTDNDFIYNTRILRIEILNEVFEYCRSIGQFSVSNLKDYLIKSHKMSPSESLDFIELLIDGEFIISELRQSPGSSSDYLENILDLMRLKGLHESDWFQNLNTLRDKLTRYSLLPLGEGLNSILDLYSYMGKFSKAKGYIHVDLEEISQGVQIESEDMSVLFLDLKDLLNFMLALSGTNNYSLNDYKQLFLENYGTDNSIPLLTLLDTDLGIGLPAGYKNPYTNSLLDSNTTKMSQNHIKEIVKRLLNRATYTNMECVNLSDHISLFNLELGAIDHTEYIELALSIVQGLDKTPEISVAPSFGSQSMGAMIGRFTYLLADGKVEIYKNYKRLFQDEKNSFESPVVEISELPNVNSLGDIVKNNNCRDYKILSNLYDNESEFLTLDSISVGVSSKDKKWYVYSNELQSEIIVKNSSYLNPYYFSNATRFLVEASNNNQKNMFTLLENLDIEEMEYQPRIQFKNIILKPRVWRFFNSYSKTTYDEFLDKFLEWRESWSVPELVYIDDSDKRLPISLVDDRSMEMLYAEFKRKGKIQLQEIGNGFNEKSMKFYRIKEVILQAKLESDKKCDEIFDKQILENKVNPIRVTAQYHSQIAEYREEIGKQWTSILIYVEKSHLRNFILKKLAPFINEISQSKILGNFYYLIFDNNDSHIKLKFDNRHLNKYVVYDWLSIQIQNKDINNYKVESYTPEIEKFGGITSFNVFEGLRSYESLVNLRILSLSLRERVVISCTYLMELISKFGLTEYEKVLFLENELGKGRLPEWYTKDKSFYLNKIISSEHNMLSTISYSNKLLEKFIEQVKSDDQDQRLTNWKSKIIFHVFHQFCNRNGIDLDLEYELKIVVLAIYKAQYYKDK